MKSAPNFYDATAQELQTQFDYVSNLVAKAPGPSGAWKEHIFRSFLVKHLPKKFSVGTGYIKNIKTGTCSKQIDILIYDNFNYAPIHQYDDFVVIPSESALIAIEVKSQFSKETLNQALENNIGAKTSDNTTPFCFNIFLETSKEYINFFNLFRDIELDMPENAYPVMTMVWDKFLGYLYMSKQGLTIRTSDLSKDEQLVPKLFPFFLGNIIVQAEEAWKQISLKNSQQKSRPSEVISQYSNILNMGLNTPSHAIKIGKGTRGLVKI